MIVEAALFVVVFYLCWLYLTRPPPDYPPTPPIRLPIFGHIHYLMGYGSDPNVGFDKVFQKYGKDGVVAVHMGKLKMALIGTLILMYV